MITLADARRIIAAAEKKAEDIGQPMNIAVADAGGNLVAHVRMDNAWMGSIDIAIKKAWTARAFDIETKALAELSQSGDQFFGIHASNNGKVMIFAGGIPLRRGDLVVGAIGVSGGMGKQDHAVAEAGAEAFNIKPCELPPEWQPLVCWINQVESGLLPPDLLCCTFWQRSITRVSVLE